ncbi:MAG: hypothetical protein VX246_11010 [Myxococcota bacterium]|nr:hypothetical protein [Myxococcota bacterium]
MPDESLSDTARETETDEALRCDFCGEPSPNVRRVALDRDYDRLQTRHKTQYACDTCSERKEKERLGLAR